MTTPADKVPPVLERVTASNLGTEYKWFGGLCDRLAGADPAELLSEDRRDLLRAVRVLNILLRAANDFTWTARGADYLHKAQLAMEGE